MHGGGMMGMRGGGGMMHDDSRMRDGGGMGHHMYSNGGMGGMSHRDEYGAGGSSPGAFRGMHGGHDGLDRRGGRHMGGRMHDTHMGMMAGNGLLQPGMLMPGAMPSAQLAAAGIAGISVDMGGMRIAQGPDGSIGFRRQRSVAGFTRISQFHKLQQQLAAPHVPLKPLESPEHRPLVPVNVRPPPMALDEKAGLQESVKAGTPLADAAMAAAPVAVDSAVAAATEAVQGLNLDSGPGLLEALVGTQQVHASLVSADGAAHRSQVLGHVSNDIHRESLDAGERVKGTPAPKTDSTIPDGIICIPATAVTAVEEITVSAATQLESSTAQSLQTPAEQEKQILHPSLL